MAFEDSKPFVAALERKNFVVFDDWLKEKGAGYYHFCISLCLENVVLAQKLFEKSLRSALRAVPQANQSVDIWFYALLHKEWIKFARFKKILAEDSQLMITVDWNHPLGRQHQEVLARLTPTEREIFLHRVMSGFNFNSLKEITGMKSDEILAQFHTAVRKVM